MSQVVGRARLRGSRGAFLALVAIILMLLLALVGLALDLGLAMAGQAKQQRVAEHTALSALGEYARVEANQPASSYDERLTAALGEAQQLAGKERNLLVVNSFRETPDLPDVPRNLKIISDPDSDGTLYPGRWFETFETCESYDGSCPCGTSEQDFRPCFVENPSTPVGQPDRRRVNAMQVDLHLPQDSLFRPLFMKLLGIDGLQVRARAAATYVPRRGVFLVDLGRSVTWQTHFYSKPPNGGRCPFDDDGIADGVLPEPPNESVGLCARYVFRLDPAFEHACFNDPFGIPPPCISNPNACSFTEIKARLIWKNMREQRDDSVVPASEYPIRHFRSDYRCFQRSFRVWDPVNNQFGPPITEKYLVDVWRNPSRGYYGAEPFTSILRAVNSALKEFEKRAISGDEVGIIGYENVKVFAPDVSDPADENALQPRVARMVVPDAQDTGPRKFQDLVAMTDVDAAGQAQYEASMRKRIEEYFFLPRPVESNATTSSPLGLLQAMEELGRASESVLAQSFVVHFTDGLTVCTLGVAGGCGNDFGSHAASLQQVQDIAGDMKGQGIALHNVLLGNVVKPHSVVMKSTRRPNQCMSDSEYRSSGRDDLYFVDPNMYGPPAAFCFPYGGVPKPNCPAEWYYSNMLYFSSRESGGLWLPIRPPCEVLSGSCGVEEALNAQCQDADLGDPIIWGFAPAGTEVVDPFGRLTCDPQCRTQSEQMVDAVKEIMSINPFVLVDGGAE